MSNPFPPLAADPLAAALHGLRLSGAFYCRSELTAPWGTTLPQVPECLMFHAVVEGQCWLDTPGAAPVHLPAGHFALVPSALEHRLLSAPGTPAPPLFDLPCQTLSERYEVRRHEGGGEPTLLLCGALHLDMPVARRLLAHLPDRIVVPTAELGGAGRWQAVLQWMGEEARTLRPGGEAVLTRLADVLVIQCLRHWMAQDPAAQRGWLGAMQDPRLGRALAALHRDPARAWTLEALAAEANLSRSAFAARFQRGLSMSPMQYLAQWRMDLAAERLGAGGQPVAAIAADLGYQSDAAFNRAFKRHTGQTPGAHARARQDARNTAPG